MVSFSGINLDLNKKSLFLILILALLAFLFISYTGSKKGIFQDAYTPYDGAASSSAPVDWHQPAILVPQPQQQQPAHQEYAVHEDEPSPVTHEPMQQPTNDAASLLPTQDNNSAWSTFQPTAGGNQMPDLLEPRQFIGLDTVGQTLKNANLQLRSEPVIPKTNSWGINMSSYEPDRQQVAFEIGSSGSY